MQVDKLEISEEELTLIRRLGNKENEKLLFTCLCLAKYYNFANPKNGNWCNMPLLKLFKLANMTGRKEDKLLAIFHVKNAGYLSLANRIDNNNLRVEIIGGKGKYPITSLTDLGNQYLVLTGEALFCQKCGTFTKQNKNRTRKYCEKCATSAPVDKRAVTCEDCGKIFYVPARNTRSTRCEECYAIYRRKYKTQKEAQRRSGLVDKIKR